MLRDDRQHRHQGIVREQKSVIEVGGSDIRCRDQADEEVDPRLEARVQSGRGNKRQDLRRDGELSRAGLRVAEKLRVLFDAGEARDTDDRYVIAGVAAGPGNREVMRNREALVEASLVHVSG
jgi:hypothetical protein